MNISVLASGSRGNCTLIHDDNNAILIDMGISTRKLKQALAQLHLNIEDLDAIFITHSISTIILSTFFWIKNL